MVRAYGADPSRTADGKYATLAELQAALDAWVTEYNTARPHPVLRRPPAKRFQLAGRNKAAAEPGPVPRAAAPPAGPRRPAGVSRRVNAHGKISLGGFTYAAGASVVLRDWAEEQRGPGVVDGHLADGLRAPDG